MKIKDRLFIVFFIVLIMLIPSVSILQKDAILSITENRNLARFPQLNQLKKHTYFSSIDTYLNDHFGLRKGFISVYDSISTLFPRPKTQNGALFGEDNYLFFRDSVKYYEGRVSQELVTEFLSQLRQFRTRHKDIPLCIVVVPNKTFVYSNKLPRFVKRGNVRSNTMNALNTIEDTLVIDLLDVDFRASGRESYMKYDTHWNGWGAYLGYKEIIQRLNQAYDLGLSVKEDIKSIDIEHGYSGDLANMIKKKGYLFDDKYHVRFKENNAIDTPKRFPGVTDANYNDHINPNGKLNMFIIHDSYIGVIRPYLAETFSKQTLLWSFDFALATKQIKEVKPDFILIQIVDRNMMVFQ